VKRIIELESHVDALRARIAELQADLAAASDVMAARERAVHASYRRDLVPVEPAAVVVWRPTHRSR
jgi:MerR family transcriptional regulator/heat shock protein HspR